MGRCLRNLLSYVVKPEALQRIHNSCDVIGDIAIIRDDGLEKNEAEKVAEKIMSIRGDVKTVLAQTGAIEGTLRLRKLRHIAGENKTETVYRESGCMFRVDVEKCYFSPRLSRERIRIANQIREDEIAFNMFAGVGSFSIIMAKHLPVKKIYSVDINLTAVRYMQENIRTNGNYGKIIPIVGDSQDIAKNLLHSVTRVLMPLPERALEYLPSALMTLTREGGWIYYYGFEHANKSENPLEKAQSAVARRLGTLEVSLTVNHSRVVRTTGPNWHQVVLDILVD